MPRCALLFNGLRQDRLRNDGFSLVEMLVAMVVLAVLCLFLASMIGQASRLWIGGEDQSDYRLKARAALDYIGRDLKLAMLSPNNPSLEFVINPPRLDAAYQCRDAVFWEAPIASDTSRGELAEIGYFVQWDNSNTIPRANLCRFEVDPTDTTNYAVYGTPAGWSSNPGGWITSQNLSAVAPATQAKNYQGLFLANVIGIWVQGYTDALLTDTAHSPYNSLDSPYTGDSYRAAPLPPTLPATVEVALLVLDKKTAARLTQGDENTIKGVYSGQTITSTPGAYAQATAAAALARLPASLAGGASVISLKVPLADFSP